MFATPEYVARVTGYDIGVLPLSKVIIAQTLIESLIGRTEAEVENPNDLALLANAVSYQTVYMVNNADRVWDQVAATYVQSGQSAVTYDTNMDSPWFSPLAVKVCRNLSWRRARSVHTGPISKGIRPLEWVRD
jgi:hypothetical protein